MDEKREKAAHSKINSNLVLALIQGQQGTFLRDVSTLWIISNGWNPTGKCFKITEDSCIVKRVPSQSLNNLESKVGWFGE